MKKHYLFLLLLTLATPHTQAQTTRDHDDVVYLKNGSVIRGTLLENPASETGNGSVKLQTYDGNIFVWDISEVSRLAGEPTIYKKRRNPLMPSTYRGRYNPSPKGYLGIVEIGFGVGTDLEPGSPDQKFGGLTYGVDMVNGYRFGHHFAMGIGLGFRAYSYSEFEGDDQTHIEWEHCIPVYGHFRANFFKTDTTPFVAMNVGYQTSLSQGSYSAFFTEPSFGVAFRVSDRNCITLGMGCAFVLPYDEAHPDGRTPASFAKLKAALLF